MYWTKGGGIGEGVDLNRLLAELHAKRKWLDEVIRGLEEVSRSPELKFVAAITEIFDEERGSQPKVDLLSRQKRRLARLAARVSHSKSRRESI